MKKDYWHLPFLALAMILSFYIRVINPCKDVFTWTVRLSGIDPWYYYRLVENCIHNFPNRIWFDPFTNYPFGTYTHFGPFLVYFSSIIAILTGHTHGESLRAVLAFTPAIAGILIVIPMYVFTSEVFNKRVGIISSFLIAIIPGQYLHRSLLGFNDHHCWETFWMITTLALYVYALKIWRSADKIDKSVLTPSILAGVAYGMYLYTWAPSFFFAIFLTTFVIISLILKKFFETSGILEVTAITISVASILYLPFAFKAPFSTTHYSPFQLIILLGCLALLSILKVVENLKPYYSKVCSKIGVGESVAYPATVLILFATSLSILALLAPQVLNMAFGVTGVIRPRGGALTIAEVQPFFYMGGSFNLSPAWYHFGMTFFFGIFGFFYTLYLIYRKKDINHLLVVFLCILLFIALWGQNRFAYYFALVCAITSALALDFIIDILGLFGKKRKLSTFRIFIVAIAFLALFDPTFSLTMEQSKYAGGINKEWFDSLTWLKNNTPDGNYDEYFYDLYNPSKNSTYPYPFKTYGVMSWWDYGHWIESISHRMPNANPFQQGIGNKYDKVPGASWFFTAFNEDESEYVAEKLNVKYVISDVEMLTGKYYAMAVWAEGDLGKAARIYYEGSWLVYTSYGMVGLAPTVYDLPPNARVIGTMNVPSENWFRTTEAKLHLLDCSGLSHYRLIYESGLISERSWMGFQEIVYKQIFDQRYAEKFGLKPVNVTTSGYVKIFERVKGAKIYGKASSDFVIVEVKVKTNQGRIFTYSNSAKVVNGEYEIVLPYAQNTTYPVKAITSYTLRAGNVTKTFSLSDEDVEFGTSMRIDLM